MLSSAGALPSETSNPCQQARRFQQRLQQEGYFCQQNHARSKRVEILLRKCTTAAWNDRRSGSRVDKRASKLEQKRTLQAAAPVLLVALPAFAAITVASLLGKLVLSVVTGVVGVAILFTAGITAVTVLLPATLFIGGILSVAALFGSLTLGAAFSLGLVGFLATRGRKEKLQAADFSEARQKFVELERREKEEQSELERARLQREELLDFDRRLQDRDRSS